MLGSLDSSKIVKGAVLYPAISGYPEAPYLGAQGTLYQWVTDRYFKTIKRRLQRRASHLLALLVLLAAAVLARADSAHTASIENEISD